MKFMIPKFNLCHLCVYMCVYIYLSLSVYECASEDFVVQTCTNIWQSQTHTATIYTCDYLVTQAQTVQMIAAERNWKLYLYTLENYFAT